jgi:hypothetical protein
VEDPLDTGFRRYDDDFMLVLEPERALASGGGNLAGGTRSE